MTQEISITNCGDVCCELRYPATPRIDRHQESEQ
jgi:hypothetical protein